MLFGATAAADRPTSPAIAGREELLRDFAAVFGDPGTTRWLSPAVDAPSDAGSLGVAIAEWARADAEQGPPVGHWAVRRLDDGVLVGAVSVRRLPPELEDLELVWQIAPEHRREGYAEEAARAVADWAFTRSAHELLVVTPPGNAPSTGLARKLGMEWVGETCKYYGVDLDVYRLWPSELTASAA